MNRSKTLLNKAGLILLSSTLLQVSCTKKYIIHQVVEPVTTTVEHRINSFRFEPEANGDFINDIVNMSIDGTAISGRIPYYSNIRTLKATFQVTDSTQVLVNGKPQESGITENDFTKPVEYQLVASNGTTKTYTINLTNFTGLPVIRINTDRNTPVDTKDTYVKGKIQVDGAGLFPDFQNEISIRGRGNSTWLFAKKPYKLKFDKKQSLLGEAADKEWCLLANYSDKSSLRNATAFMLGSVSSLQWTPKTHFVELFLNEVYLGTYQLCEDIKIADGRLNISDDGFLVEVDQLDRLGADDVYFNTSRLLFNIKDPDVDKDDSKYNFIKDYVNNAENALYGKDFADPVNGYARYLDVDSYVDWYLINEIARNNDAVFFSSCYMNLAPQGKLSMGPIWDFDIAFGNINFNGNESPEGLWIRNSPWMTRLFEDPAFVQKVHTRFGYYRSRQKDMIDFINNQSVRLRWSVLSNNAKWRTLYTENWPNYAVWGSYDNEVQYLKNWINARMAWLETEFAALASR